MASPLEQPLRFRNFLELLRRWVLVQVQDDGHAYFLECIWPGAPQKSVVLVPLKVEHGQKLILKRLKSARDLLPTSAFEETTSIKWLWWLSQQNMHHIYQSRMSVLRK